MFDELHHLREILRIDSAFAEALCSTETTTEAAQLVWEHGITVTPEALWRNRGTLASGGCQPGEAESRPEGMLNPSLETAITGDSHHWRQPSLETASD